MTLSISNRLQLIRDTISQCTTSPIHIVAVSKGQSVEKIQEAVAAGQYAFGENYLQEALLKIQNVTSPIPITWHFLGTIQSNKAKTIATHFQWVQTLCRTSIAEALNAHRPLSLPPLNVLIQVNINEESTKSGVLPGEVILLAKAIQQLPQLKLRGLMAIPKAHQSKDALTHTFHSMFLLFHSLQPFGDIDTLSLGMSMDYPLAIQEGATMVRIGTALFGERESRHE